MLMRADTHINLEITGVPVYRPSLSWSQVIVSVPVFFRFIIVGFYTAYTSPALVSTMQPNSTLLATTQQASWIGCFLPLSPLIGSVTGGLLIEWIGRRATILTIVIPYIVSWLLMGLAETVPVVHAGRVLAGLCVGVTSLCLAVSKGEAIQPAVRGMLGLISVTVQFAGILVCFLAGKYLNRSNLAYMCAIITVFFLLCTLFIPETSKLNISKGQCDEAAKSLEHGDVSQEASQIEETHATENARVSIGEFFNKGNLKPILIFFGLIVLQQLSGIHAVIFYTLKIIQGAGSSLDQNHVIVLCAVSLGCTFLPLALVDRLGRRVLLGISDAVMVSSLALLGTFCYLRDTEVDVTAFGWLPMLSFVVFVIGFSVGFGPIPWVVLGEILPARIRDPATWSATAINSMWSFLVTKTFDDLELALGAYSVFWTFGVLCFISLFFFLRVRDPGQEPGDMEKTSREGSEDELHGGH